MVRRSPLLFVLPLSCVLFSACQLIEPPLQQTHTVSVSVSPLASGSVVPSGGTWDDGSAATFTAFPANGYVFDRWDGIIGSENPVTIVVEWDLEITARFARLYAYRFKNDSSHSVTVIPWQYQTWEQFELERFRTITVESTDDEISFDYEPVDLVKFTDSIVDWNATAGETITFHNRTLLTVSNRCGSDLLLIEWETEADSLYFFGNDDIWCATLGEPVGGMRDGHSDTEEVSPGSGYISFWFAEYTGQYRTSDVVTIEEGDQIYFTFYGSTYIEPVSNVAVDARASLSSYSGR
ncbi:MAG: hypothetical protein WC683_07835 [bacterium]